MAMGPGRRATMPLGSSRISDMHLHLPSAAPRLRNPSPSRRTKYERLDELEAELVAILVDLEARARFGKVEGAARPLLAHAKDVSRRLEQLVAQADDPARRRFAADLARLRGQLATVEHALAALSPAE